MYLQQAAVGEILEILVEVELALLELRLRRVGDLDQIRLAGAHRHDDAGQLVGRHHVLVIDGVRE